MEHYKFNRAVFVGWAITAILAVVYVGGGIRQMLGGPQLSLTWLIWLLTALTLCWANTTAREMVAARLFLRKTRIKIAAIFSHIRLLIPKAAARIRNLAGLFIIGNNNHLQTEP